jgi:hypothetical protein
VHGGAAEAVAGRRLDHGEGDGVEGADERELPEVRHLGFGRGVAPETEATGKLLAGNQAGRQAGTSRTMG